MPDNCHSEPSCYPRCGRLNITTGNGLPSATLMPPASSGHGARNPLGWSTSRPPTTMAHTGPNQLLPWPWHPCYSQARPILSLTMTESTKKRSRATDLRCPPAAVGRGHRVMLGTCGQPTAQATQTCHRRTRQRRGLAPPRVRHSSGASWLAGGSEDGKRNGEEKTTHNLRDTHWAFLPGGRSAVWAPGLGTDAATQPCC